MTRGVPVNVLRQVTRTTQVTGREPTSDVSTRRRDDDQSHGSATLDGLAAFSLPRPGNGPDDDQEGDEDDGL